MVENAVYKDAGEYICMAENDLGKATASIRVSVEGSLLYFIFQRDLYP
jgi:hypothetical protein